MGTFYAKENTPMEVVNIMAGRSDLPVIKT